MAIRKVYGIETEYGIDPRGMGEKNPIAASSVLINVYVNELQRKVGWDFEDEHPGNDARGFAREGSMPPEVETHLVNAVLTNGARYYVDHAHPEFSTPECADALQCVLYDKAGERILARSMEAAARALPTGQGIVVYKNNSDRKGNSYGTHENYLMDRQVPFARVVQHVMPHFVSRQIYTGAGKVGTEASSTGGVEVEFQLTQRADFFEEEVGLETTLKRPIVNTRDEPHADAQKYRRLHVIVGDANMAEIATFLKLGVTALVLCMIEDDWFGERDFTLETPVAALRKVSYDVSLQQPLTLAGGSTMTALEMQWEYFDLARKYAEDRGLEALGDSRPRGAGPVGDGADRAGDRPHVAGRPAGLGREVPAAERVPRAPQHELDRPTAWRPWTSSTTTCGPSGRCSPGSPCSACWPSLRCRRRSPSRPATPGPISGASASRSGHPRLPPPIGIHWCSTWVVTRSGEWQ